MLAMKTANHQRPPNGMANNAHLPTASAGEFLINKKIKTRKAKNYSNFKIFFFNLNN
jgi:hypothetical protein